MAAAGTHSPKCALLLPFAALSQSRRAEGDAGGGSCIRLQRICDLSGFCARAGVSRAHISGHPVPDREGEQRPGTLWMLQCGALRGLRLRSGLVSHRTTLGPLAVAFPLSVIRRIRPRTFPFKEPPSGIPPCSSDPRPPEPERGVSWGEISAELRAESEDRTENLCVALEETVLGSGAHTDYVPGRVGLGRLGRPSWVRVVSRAFPLRAPRFGTSLRTVATWSRTLCLFEPLLLRLTPGSA